MKANNLPSAMRLRGELHPHAKLSDNDIVVIKQRRAAGEKLLSIALDFGVCESMISKIANGRRRA